MLWKIVYISNVMFLFLSLWKLLQARHSQLASVAVPLLLHCLTLPTGADMLWKIVEDDFGNEDWKCRFAAGQFEEMLFSNSFL